MGVLTLCAKIIRASAAIKADRAVPPDAPALSVRNVKDAAKESYVIGVRALAAWKLAAITVKHAKYPVVTDATITAHTAVSLAVRTTTPATFVSNVMCTVPTVWKMDVIRIVPVMYRDAINA